jgi:purine-binding chemotaxis protein CheW
VEASTHAAANRFLTFRVDAQLYALRSEQVSEVIRVPALARIPQAPTALLGVANLRGAVLPVAGARELLKKSAAANTSNSRAIVLDIGAPVALLVDSIEALETIDAEHVETRKKELSAEGAEKLLGAFAVGQDKEVAKILDVKVLLESAFVNRARAEPKTRSVGNSAALHSQAEGARSVEMLVTFEVAGQEFALPLRTVQEILPLPATVAPVARAETLVVGVISVRDALLPLMSLRGLLGFGPADKSLDQQKIIVVNLDGAQVGLVADGARAIVAAELDSVDPIPPALAARTGGETQIRGIYRADGGRRLISILSTEQLFREDVMQRLTGTAANPQSLSSSSAVKANSREQIFLVFRLGDDEFGLPIESVVEVAQVPEQITRLPKTPKFLEGVVNLRGEVLPVVDQRRRFDMPPLQAREGRRLVIMKTERHRAGLIVDSVADVLRTRAENIEPPPDLTDDTSQLIRGVINLQESHRLVLLLDPTEVLTRAEQKLLDSFQVESKKANA